MTDHDLRQVLLDAVPPLPTPPDRIQTIGRRVRRQRLRFAAVSAAASVTVLALAAATVTLLHGSGSAGNSLTAGAVPTRSTVSTRSVAIAPLTFMFGPYSAGAYRVLPPQEVTRTYQTANIVTDGRDSSGKAAIVYVGTLTVYRPGIHPPKIFTSGTRITVHGLPGVAAERAQDNQVVINGEEPFANGVGAMANTLAWQYADNSWVVINSVIQIPDDLSHRLTAADERALADAFSLGTPSRARIPFQAGYLPTGWQVASVSGRSFTAEDLAQVRAIFAPSSPATADQIRHFAGSTDGPAVVITVIHIQNPPPPDAPKNPKTCVQDGVLKCHWDIPHTQYAVVVYDPTGTLSKTELTKIGQGLTFDNPDKPGTWHPVS